jgi:hypothetical protein
VNEVPSTDAANRSTPQAAAAGSATLTFRGGGWVIALAAVLVVLLMGWSLLPVLLGHRPIGDGRSVESYGFDLSTLTVDRATLVGSGNPRGFLPSLDEPKHLRGSEMLVYNSQNRPKFVVPTDRVIGIVIDGKAHAWPLSLMNAHEVVNDTVAGRSVLATYSPLCDTAMVFDRTVAGSVRQFEVSGLLYDSNLAFSEKLAPAAPAAPSLFSQLEARAIAGPLAKDGVTLSPLPDVCITTWADWLARHPTTTVTLRDPTMIRRMKEISYAHYFLSRELQAPAAPLPGDDDLARNGLRLKSPMIAVRSAEGRPWTLLSIESLVAAGLSPERTVRVTIDGAEHVVTIPIGPAVARIERADGKPVLSVPVLYFAAHAILGQREGVELAPIAAPAAAAPAQAR